MKQRLFLALLSLVGLTIVSFGAGYATYPLFHQVNDFRPAAEADASGTESVSGDDPLDLNIYWQVRHLLERDYYGDAPTEQAQVYASVRGLVESYNDPYTYFVEPQPRELERDQLRGSFGGIGAYIETTEAGFFLQPMPGQPAIQAGIAGGDQLLRVDETPITPEMTSDEVIALVRGPVDTDVRLRVRRLPAEGDGPAEELDFTITRAIIETPSVAWELREDAQGDLIGVIALSIFNERSAEEVRAATEDLQAQGATRFVLDVRGNPGGLVTAAVEIADMWLEEGDILIEKRADGSRSAYTAEAGDIIDGAPLVVVVDGASASASEIVAGALQDHGRARLVGERTFGKGSVQLIHELTDQSSLHVTNAEWFTPNGSALTGVGLTPDREIGEGEDPIAVAIETVAAVALADDE
ncbi:MAG: S41 family peptidase [Caldilineaceae bacterium]|nr:S41 family peptidase [Caldilineaceae bacterium]